MARELHWCVCVCCNLHNYSLQCDILLHDRPCGCVLSLIQFCLSCSLLQSLPQFVYSERDFHYNVTWPLSADESQFSRVCHLSLVVRLLYIWRYVNCTSFNFISIFTCYCSVVFPQLIINRYDDDDDALFVRLYVCLSVCLSICPSVCLSRSRTVSKRANIHCVSKNVPTLASCSFDTTYSRSYYGTPIGTYTSPVAWCHFQWPWMTPNFFFSYAWSAGGIFGFPQLVYSPRYSRGGWRGRRLPSPCFKGTPLLGIEYLRNCTR